MKKIILALPTLLLLAIAACSPSATPTNEKGTADTIALSPNAQADTSLTAKLAVPQIIGTGVPIEMTFTVYNKTDSVRTFCKWHTPFEPLMSKYLDITMDGKEVPYKGPMAKRMMPPPASSYLSVKPGDSLSVKVDLMKAYDIKSSGFYKIKYNSETISGLKVTDSVSINLRN
jgi:hypothetical protein